MLRLDYTSHDAVSFACRRWHYSRTVPTPPYVRIGVWEDQVFKGVVLYSRGNASHGARAMGLEHTEMAELTRVAMTTHAATVSRIIRISLKLLRERSPGLRLLVSFADPQHNHHGGIYQAGGWLYVGMTAPSTQYLAPDGKQWHSRMISEKGYNTQYGATRRVWKPSECQLIDMPGKHKYLMPLDAAMREQITPMIKPYPKKLAQAA